MINAATLLSANFTRFFFMNFTAQALLLIYTKCYFYVIYSDVANRQQLVDDLSIATGSLKTTTWHL